MTGGPKVYRLIYRVTTERSLEFVTPAGAGEPARVAAMLLPTGEGVVEVAVVSIDEVPPAGATT